MLQLFSLRDAGGGRPDVGRTSPTGTALHTAAWLSVPEAAIPWEWSSPPPQQLIHANRQRQCSGPTPPFPSYCRCSHPRFQPWDSASSDQRRPGGESWAPSSASTETRGAAEAKPGVNGQGGFQTTEPKQNPQENQKSVPRASSARVRHFNEESCWPPGTSLEKTPARFLSPSRGALGWGSAACPQAAASRGRAALKWPPPEQAGGRLGRAGARPSGGPPRSSGLSELSGRASPEERSRVPLQLQRSRACRPGGRRPQDGLRCLHDTRPKSPPEDTSCLFLTWPGTCCPTSYVSLP